VHRHRFEAPLHFELCRAYSINEKKSANSNLKKVCSLFNIEPPNPKKLGCNATTPGRLCRRCGRSLRIEWATCRQTNQLKRFRLRMDKRMCHDPCRKHLSRCF
jgi:hypothetical protein